ARTGEPGRAGNTSPAALTLLFQFSALLRRLPRARTPPPRKKHPNLMGITECYGRNTVPVTPEIMLFTIICKQVKNIICKRPQRSCNSFRGFTPYLSS
ncbi:hypothetical protein, partial [Cronobacter sakazakii]|uniref:hypothetical protein n=1 Tax=Cronobacter sakazakii TaxID=28141 RepID=UPI00294B910E